MGDIGVLFVLFCIGLEFRLKNLRNLYFVQCQCDSKRSGK